MKNIKNDGLALTIEDKIKQLMHEMGYINCIKPDGKLNDRFIVEYLTQHNKEATKDYVRVVTAYAKLRNDVSFVKESNQKVSKETLKKFVFEYEFIVRPIKTIQVHHIDGVFAGEIIKLPEKDARDFSDGEGWKALLEQSSRKVGDKIIYWYKNNIILDSELLHLVSSISGRILD
jgi:hypothetical protein